MERSRKDEKRETEKMIHWYNTLVFLVPERKLSDLAFPCRTWSLVAEIGMRQEFLPIGTQHLKATNNVYLYRSFNYITAEPEIYNFSSPGTAVILGTKSSRIVFQPMKKLLVEMFRAKLTIFKRFLCQHNEEWFCQLSAICTCDLGLRLPTLVLALSSIKQTGFTKQASLHLDHLFYNFFFLSPHCSLYLWQKLVARSLVLGISCSNYLQLLWCHQILLWKAMR